MISWRQLEQFVKTAIRMLKGRRRDQAAFFVTALCFSGGFALGKFVDGKWIASLQIALYAIGAIALVYGVVRVWRLVNPPELPPAKDRPSAIKGLMAFTEADGDLFRKLGRESELQRLLGLVLDHQVLMVLVRGASGAGKTSLLRAGLNDILGDRVVFHYWEAVPVEPDKGLLRAIQETWPEGAAKPDTLAELVNPSDALGRQSHVIVLDQFEQLRGSGKIFQLLRRIMRESKPPHRITWVIAFSREFSDDWLDFIGPEQEKGIRPPQDVPLRLFTAEQAREVIGQLINESVLRDSIEQSVINNLVEAATIHGEVSPVDIGIGLMMLTELHERQSGQTITEYDYDFAGGAEGLLTQYIDGHLKDPFFENSREAILKAMLALRDPVENRHRLATGLTIDELAVEAGRDARELKFKLNRLADRDIRLLEADTPTDGSAVRYRLPHERLIPALYRLTGKLLAEVDQAKLKFQNAFQAWQANDKRSRYLLKGKELRLVQHYETQIPWGHDEQEKKRFLFRSKRRRQFVWATAVAAVLILIGAGWFSRLQYQRFENRRYLIESGYPAELYAYQHQLKKLELTQDLNLEHFTWLSSDSIEELSLDAAGSSNSIAGLTSLSRCRSLKKLTLDLSFSQVSDLKPLAQLQGLTQLSIDLSRSDVRDLQPLAQLRGLTQLSLDLSNSDVRDLQPLAQLQGLTQLSLDLSNSNVRDLQPMAQLKGLTQLSLDLSNSDVRDALPLAQLKGPTQLTLKFKGSAVRDLQPLNQLKGLTQLSLDLRESQTRDLQPLAQLAQLKELTKLLLDLNAFRLDSGLRSDPSVRPVSDLQPLAQLKRLTQLSLDLSYSQVSDLQSLTQLQGLTQLSLDLSSSSVRHLEPLAQLKGLTELSLDLTLTRVRDSQPVEQHNKWTQLTHDLGGQLSNLGPLEQLKGLTQLRLDLSGQLSNLRLLEQLKGLTQLTLNLGVSQVSDLQPLAQLKGLTQLTLNLSSANVLDLQPLEQLKGLTQLTLILSSAQVSGLKRLEQLKHLQLKLFLGVSDVNDLQSLAQLKGLTQLSLDFRGSKVNNLESVQELTGLQALSIEYATRTQRLSLRNIPASLVELRF